MLVKEWGNLRRLARLCLLLTVMLFSIASLANGQTLDWSQPIRITDPVSAGYIPAGAEFTLAVDSLGKIHLLGATSFTDIEPPDERAAINYMVWDGTAWSQPVDVLATPGMGNTQVFAPRATLDDQGTLHVVWAGKNPSAFAELGYIYYSHAEAAEAASVRAWSTPIRLTTIDGYLTTGSSKAADIAVDADDGIHVVVVNLADDKVYHLASFDYGETWTVPTATTVGFQEPLPPEVQSALASSPRIATDAQDRLHVVWTYLRNPGGWPTLGIRYARSTDGGQTWSTPFLIDDANVDAATIAVDGGRVHLTWAGTADRGGRWHRYSEDGGETWTDVVRATPVGIWAMGDFSTMVDTEHTLHMVAGLTGFGKPGTFLTYLHWQNGVWSAPEIIHDVETENPQAILVLGNQIHAICADFSDPQRALLHTSKKLPLPAAPVVLPVVPAAAEPAVTETPEATAIPALEQTDAVTAPYSHLPAPDTSASNMLAALIVPTLLIIVIVSGVLLMYQTRSRKRT